MLEVAVTETLSIGRVFYDRLPVAVGWEVEVAVVVAVAVGITCFHTATPTHT